MRTLKELRKEINGKQVVYVKDSCNIRFDALLICPPNGEQVSVKPYGYEPEEIVAAYHEGGWGWVELETVKAKEFCFAACNVVEKVRHILEKLADMPDKGVVDWGKVTGDSTTSLFGDQPSCPYG